MVKFELNFIFL